ncbi:MAG: DinB family protein [Bacteroidota bacterium]
MNSIAKQLKDIVTTAKPRLLSIPEARASEKLYPDKWSIKQILGHLIDSAANNHQRMVRMQETTNIGNLTYEQIHWVESQQYQSEPWEDVVSLWCSYNTHIAHVIINVDASTLGNLCDMGYDEPATLKFVIEDYVRHVQHHLDQIFSDVDPRERERWVTRRPSDIVP